MTTIRRPAAPPWAANTLAVLVAIGLAGALYLLDVKTKSWADSELRRSGPQTTFGGHLVLRYRTNSGIAFGLLQAELYHRKRERLIAYSTAVSVGVALVLLIRLALGRKHPWATTAGLVLLLAGSTGNLRDRVVRGAVIDFIEIDAIAAWPAFNLADMYLFFGIPACLFGLWRGHQKRRRVDTTRDVSSDA